MSDPLPDWVDELATALDLDPSVVDQQLLLDLARDAAHNVARPAAPLTTFLVGLAAGRAGGNTETINVALSTAHALLATREPTGN